MKRTFIQTKEFSKNWDALGFTDRDLRKLEIELLENPEVGRIIQETGGLRKMRFAFEHRGKSGSSRICYVDFEIYEMIYLITVFAKNEQENLSKTERKDIKNLIKILGDELGKGVDNYGKNV